MKTAKELLLQMTLEEKAALLTGSDVWHIKNCPRLGVPPIMVSDGPHGLRKQVNETDNMGINGSIPAVCFPTAAGLASSFNRALLRELGEVLGEECRAEHVSILLGPTVNIKRSPLCGRNFECFSEDPHLTGELAASYVSGLQSKGIGASVKHFAANNQEYRRMTISSVMDERALREIYLAAFEPIVKKASPWTMMCAYNGINGSICSQNKRLLTDILRDEWGFDGYVMTDWGAAVDRVAGVAAGCDLEMPSSGERATKRLLEAVASGTLAEKDLDRAAQRILEISLRTLRTGATGATFDREADRKTARRMAAECMVLLKNEHSLLPLAPGGKVAFLGAFAKMPRYQGTGSSLVKATRVTGALEAARGLCDITYAPGYLDSQEKPDPALINEAVEAAKAADTAVVFVGLTDKNDAEGYDRPHLDLSQAHTALVEAVAAVQPNTVVVLHNGSPVAMPWIDSVPAVLEAYLGGEACGEAVTDLLFGKVNPSGKLAETFPRALQDVPSAAYFPGSQLTTEYRESIYVGYRYYDTVEQEVLFPFGHGLSYTQFTYSGLRLSAQEIGPDDSVTVTFTLKNSGTVDGAEAYQLYVAPPRGRIFRPVQELRGFDKVFLHAGEEKEVTLTLPPRAFQYYDPAGHGWRAESGVYELRIGASSRDIRLNTAVRLIGTEPAEYSMSPENLPSYFSGDIRKVSDAEFERLLGHPLPPGEREPGERYTLESTLEDAQDTVWGRRLTGIIRKIAGDKLAFYVDAAISSPIRAIITPESDAHALAIVSLLNGEHTVRSLLTLLRWVLRLKKKKS